jgi:hypothetical protein
LGIKGMWSLETFERSSDLGMAEEPSSFALAPNTGRTRIARIRIIAQEIVLLVFIGLPSFYSIDAECIYVGNEEIIKPPEALQASWRLHSGIFFRNPFSSITPDN